MGPTLLVLDCHTALILNIGEKAKEKMRDFAKSIAHPFSIYLNPYTQSREIMRDTKV